ncbi:hypothetical protein EC973_008660 [Apophysomyces ossiformis]|uniref:Uncharacterized protein n=1 Tax=Apophysomyces ossiformis TaxID=679940 RepID=A0A8H7BKR2_9FUNG|nr:hypothetical protein EC973_008660 [Apophysomyces ossiformis]
MTFLSPRLLPTYPSLLPPNSFNHGDPTSLASGSLWGRRARSVISSTSYQYASTTEGSLDNTSIHSAPPLPDDTINLSKRDIAASLESYENLLSAAKVFREHMIQLAGAAAGFGYALEKVAHSKTASETDIRQFRQALQDLTRQVDEVDRIKSDYQQHVLDMERRQHHLVLGKVSAIVRAQVDIYERISNKGLADPVLEQMIAQNPDPFCAYSSLTDEQTGIFTVLPPVSLIDTQTPTTCIGQDFGDEDDLGYITAPMLAENFKEGLAVDMEKSLYNLPKLHQNIRAGNDKRTSESGNSLSKERTMTEDEEGSADEQWDQSSSDGQRSVKKETTVGTHMDHGRVSYVDSS